MKNLTWMSNFERFRLSRLLGLGYMHKVSNSLSYMLHLPLLRHFLFIFCWTHLSFIKFCLSLRKTLAHSVLWNIARRHHKSQIRFYDVPIIILFNTKKTSFTITTQCSKHNFSRCAIEIPSQRLLIPFHIQWLHECHEWQMTNIIVEKVIVLRFVSFQ